MEKKGSDQAASDSWWLEKNGSDHNRPHQSQWLQSTLSELERKIKMILELVEDNGDTFAQRAEMYYKKRPELIKVVVDLQRSYISLANKYDLLRPESLCGGGGSSSNSFRLQSVPSSVALVHLQEAEAEAKAEAEDQGINPKISDQDQHQDGPHVCTSGSSELPDSPSTLSDLGQSWKISKDACDEKLIRDKGICNIKGNMTDNEINKGSGGINKNCKISRAGGFDYSRRDSSKISKSSTSSDSEREKMWNKMRLSVSELIEDNLSQQAELIKRNNDKRESIKELCLYINELQNENKRLKDSLAQHHQQQQLNYTGNNKTTDHRVNQTRSHMSKLKGLVFGKKQ